jgi:hypothetical protein
MRLDHIVHRAKSKARQQEIFLARLKVEFKGSYFDSEPSTPRQLGPENWYVSRPKLCTPNTGRTMKRARRD